MGHRHQGLAETFKPEHPGGADHSGMHHLTGTAIRAITRYAYVPFMLLGLNGAAIALTVAGTAKYWLLVLLAVAIGMSFLVERIIPYDSGWNHDRADSARDRVHAAVNEALILASVTAIPLLANVIPVPRSGPAVGYSLLRYWPPSSSPTSASRWSTGSATTSGCCGACTPCTTAPPACTASMAS